MSLTAHEVSPAAQTLDPSSFGIPLPSKTLGERQPGRVLVTGASTGIGWESVKTLQSRGWSVLATARREERLAALAKETGCRAFAADLTDASHVEALAEWALKDGVVDAVVNNAGGALGTDSVLEAKPPRWRRMYEINVMSALQVTQAFLPQMLENGFGDLVFVTSTAGHETYPGGAGYTAAKHAEAMLPATLRLELVGKPIRIIEVMPGLVQTPEFSLNRLGSAAEAEAVYAGVDYPLQGCDIAEGIAWALSLPKHINIDQMKIKPVEQATSTLKVRLEKR